MLNNRANALLSLGRAEEALDGFRDVLARAPQHGEARLNSGIALAALGRSGGSAGGIRPRRDADAGPSRRAFQPRPRALRLGRYAEAVAAQDAALAAAPDHAGAWLNRGRALAALNRYDEAIASYDRALALRKDDADANFMKALALLTRGDYRRGFEEYEWRWRRTGMPAHKSRGRPLWLGEYPLARKTILLHAEQGLGDTIQFARYVPVLAAGGANVVLEVQPELTALMARLKGVAKIIARGEAPPPFDVHCPLGSLPLALKTEPSTVPADIPYLSADDAHLAKWSARLGPRERPRIAIAWSGNASHLNDRNRSIPFAKLAPLFSIPAQFISIQRDVRSEEAAALAGETRVTHVGAELESFADTAAVIAQCDLVIAVDTAVAHLAGALGRPLWVLLPFAPDWRWTLDGESSPWYPTARCSVRSALGDWDAVIARVGEALKGLRRFDLDACLLAGIGDVADRGALHVALPAQVVELGAAMHGAAVVPDDEVVQPPAMGVDELPLRGMGHELLDQRAAFLLRHAEDAAGVGGEVERLAAAFRQWCAPALAAPAASRRAPRR